MIRVLKPGQPPLTCTLLRDTTLGDLETTIGGGPSGTHALVGGQPAGPGTPVKAGDTVQYQPYARNA